MAKRKLGKCGGTNLKRGVRLEMHDCFGPFPTLTSLRIERICEIGGNSCRQQCSLSFLLRDVDISHGLADGKGDLFGNLRHAQRFWSRHIVALALMPRCV